MPEGKAGHLATAAEDATSLFRRDPPCGTQGLGGQGKGGRLKVSVILPVYNAAAVLPRCLSSLAEQTFRDFEVIAVDDGSTDGSAAVLGDWRGRMPLVVVAQANGGASVARNVALERARGEYVYMLDADDFVHPRLLEWVVRAADAADADYVLFDSEDVRPDETAALRDRFAADGSPVRAEPLPVPPLRWYEEEVALPVVWRFLFRRASLAGLTFPTGIMYEDNVFVYGYLARSVRGVRLAKPLYGYVQEPSSVMHVTNVAQKMKSIDVVMRELRGRLSPRDWEWLFLRRYVLVVKAFWRNGEEVPLLRDLTRGWFRDGVMRLADFPWRWRLRFRWWLRRLAG